VANRGRKTDRQKEKRTNLKGLVVDLKRQRKSIDELEMHKSQNQDPPRKERKNQRSRPLFFGGKSCGSLFEIC